jgi:hypothetical protein
MVNSYEAPRAPAGPAPATFDAVKVILSGRILFEVAGEPVDLGAQKYQPVFDAMALSPSRGFGDCGLGAIPFS